MNDDEKLKQASFVGDTFRQSMQDAVVSANMLFDTCGIDTKERAAIFLTILAGAAAAVAQQAEINRPSFDQAVSLLADRAYQPPVDPHVTTRSRGSA